eukprot:Gb_37657 [translate_table: standard]
MKIDLSIPEFFFDRESDLCNFACASPAGTSSKSNFTQTLSSATLSFTVTSTFSSGFSPAGCNSVLLKLEVFENSFSIRIPDMSTFTCPLPSCTLSLTATSASSSRSSLEFSSEDSAFGAPTKLFSSLSSPLLNARIDF